MSIALPQTVVPPEEERRELSKRVADAFRAMSEAEAQAQETIKTEIDAAMTWSEDEQLRHQDFEKMSTEELERAKRAIARLRLPVADQRTGVWSIQSQVRRRGLVQTEGIVACRTSSRGDLQDVGPVRRQRDQAGIARQAAEAGEVVRPGQLHAARR